jgi:hypothetical protein
MELFCKDIAARGLQALKDWYKVEVILGREWEAFGENDHKLGDALHLLADMADGAGEAKLAYSLSSSGAEALLCEKLPYLLKADLLFNSCRV